MKFFLICGFLLACLSLAEAQTTVTRQNETDLANTTAVANSTVKTTTAKSKTKFLFGFDDYDTNIYVACGIAGGGLVLIGIFVCLCCCCCAQFRQNCAMLDPCCWYICCCPVPSAQAELTHTETEAIEEEECKEQPIRPHSHHHCGVVMPMGPIYQPRPFQYFDPNTMFASNYMYPTHHP